MPHAIATGHARTTEAAELMLESGGTAVDAALAAAFTAFVAEPVLAGPLGGAAAMIAEPGKAPAIFDAFVQTPRRKTPESALDLATIEVDFGAETQAFHIGGGTIAVPCLMPALADLHARLGRVPMRELAGIAAGLAREGVPLSPFQAHVSRLVAPILESDPGPLGLFGAEGKLLDAGAAFSNPDLADVLETFAIEGARFFSEGEIAEALIALPGTHITTRDLKSAAAQRRSPLKATRFGHNVYVNPSPSLAGQAISLALQVLPPRPGAVARAKAYEGVDHLRKADGTGGSLAALRARVLGTKPATKGTTHISVIDGAGLMVALTLTNGEGCGRLLPGTGIMPNNMLGEEDLCPSGPLDWAEDTRLATMMCPMLIESPGQMVTLLGSGGSSRIRTALAEATLRLTDFADPLPEAVAAPRLHMEAGRLSFEPMQAREDLLAEWPEARAFDGPNMFFGGVHAVQATRSGAFLAAADQRREGVGAAKG